MTVSAAPLGLFSVIMPTYNYERYLRQSVESVLAQQWRDWELIVADDGSTDNTWATLEELARRDPRIRALRRPHRGVAATRNAAIAAARGRYLAFLDSDDVWVETALASYVEYLTSHPDAQFIYGCYNRWNRDGSITELERANAGCPTDTAKLFHRICMTTSCVCYSRELFERVGGFDTSLVRCEDYDLYLRMSMICPLEPTGRLTTLARRHEDNVQRASADARRMQAEVLERFLIRQGCSCSLDPSAAARLVGRTYCSAARRYLKQRRYRESLCAARRARANGCRIMGGLLSAISYCLQPLGKSEVQKSS